jgi:pimeloyl-ACP methyl ester carboxylesterase
MKIRILLAFILISVTLSAQNKPEQVSFNAKDGLEITADLYKTNDAYPYMLLFHQAGFSRGEYKNTAQIFNNFGYNCLAIDQRSGDIANGIINETAKRAKAKELSTPYIEAYQDMEAALDYAYKKSGKPIVVVGSSYSAALVLRLASENIQKISKVLAYSPGEYIQGHSVAAWSNLLETPVFVTSSKAEAESVADLVKGSSNEKLVHFTPKGEGVHGSRVLWKSTANNQEYWVATRIFLTTK